MPQPARRRLPIPIRRALTAVIGLAGIAAVIVFLNPAKVGSALEHFQLALIAPIILLSVLVYILQGIRWHYLLIDVGTKLRLRDTILDQPCRSDHHRNRPARRSRLGRRLRAPQTAPSSAPSQPP